MLICLLALHWKKAYCYDGSSSVCCATYHIIWSTSNLIELLILMAKKLFFVALLIGGKNCSWLHSWPAFFSLGECNKLFQYEIWCLVCGMYKVNSYHFFLSVAICLLHHFRNLMQQCNYITCITLIIKCTVVSFD